MPEGVDWAQGADQEGAGDWRDACGSGGSVIEDDRMGQNPSGEQYRFTIEEMRLARKLGQIIGFHFDIEEFSEPAGPAQKMQFKPQLVIETIKSCGMDARLISEAE